MTEQPLCAQPAPGPWSPHPICSSQLPEGCMSGEPSEPEAALGSSEAESPRQVDRSPAVGTARVKFRKTEAACSVNIGAVCLEPG